MDNKSDPESKSLGEIMHEFTEEYIKLAEKMLELVETLWSLWLREGGKEMEK